MRKVEAGGQMHDFDEWLKRLDQLFVEALTAIEDTTDQQAYWETQPTHWEGGGDRDYIEEYRDLVRLHAELRRLMNRRTGRLRREE
jgi:hypothetical protein